MRKFKKELELDMQLPRSVRTVKVSKKQILLRDQRGGESTGSKTAKNCNVHEFVVKYLD